jgi:adenine deaminase
MTDELITKAIEAIADTDGGLAVVSGSGEVTILPLPIAGLMSDAPYEEVNDEYKLVLSAYSKLSDVSYDPFLTLSFLALPVIPSLKLTDQGLFDYDTFSFIDINVK